MQKNRQKETGFEIYLGKQQQHSTARITLTLAQDAQLNKFKYPIKKCREYQIPTAGLGIFMLEYSTGDKLSTKFSINIKKMFKKFHVHNFIQSDYYIRAGIQFSF